MVFRKNLRSLERRWEKISKFLGDLPSEQIFYRNIPLGAPEYRRNHYVTGGNKTLIYKTLCMTRWELVCHMSKLMLSPTFLLFLLDQELSI